MTTLQISTLNTLTYNEEEATKALAITTGVMSIVCSVLQIVRRWAAAVILRCLPKTQREVRDGFRND
ncbi:MAG: hypothetical protein ABL879_02215 [Devosia sp.]